MDTQHRGKRFAIHVLFAGLACVIASTTGFLLTARSQTIEIWRGDVMTTESFEPAKTWTPPSQNSGQPEATAKSDASDADTTELPSARDIMAVAVKNADKGNFEEAIRIAKIALNYEGDWTANELTPTEFIQNWEAELAFVQRSAENPLPETATSDQVEQPRLVERPTFEAPVQVATNEQQPTRPSVPNEPVELKVPPFAWEPVAKPETASNDQYDTPQDNAGDTMTADADESRQHASETQLASQDSFAANSPTTDAVQPRVWVNEFPRNGERVQSRSDSRGFTIQPNQPAEGVSSGVHFNIAPNAPQPVAAAKSGDEMNSFYAVLAVLSLIFVFGFSLVFLATFILLKDRNQNQAQDNVLRLDVGSLQGLAQLAQFGGAPYGMHPQQQMAPVPAAQAAADPQGVPAAGSAGVQPTEEISDEDAMFQHLLEDNIEMYRNINQLPNAA